MEEENNLLSWLTDLNLSEYHDTLINNGYSSPKQLISIKDRDHLKTIGVTKMGHVSRLLRAIEKIRTDSGCDANSLPPQENTVVDSSITPASVERETISKKPPPIPVRKSIRHYPSAPNTSINKPSTATVTSSSRGPPPPVQPRDQSLKRTKPLQPGSGRSMSNLASPPPSSLTFDGPVSNRRQANPEEPKNPVVYPASSSTLPPKPFKIPTPKPRNKPQPAPRKRSHSKSATYAASVKDTLGKVSSTLPVGTTLMSNGQEEDFYPIPLSPEDQPIRSFSSDVSHKTSETIQHDQGGNAIFELENVPLPVNSIVGGIKGPTTDGDYEQPLFPPKDVGPPSFPPPPVQPERKENSTPSEVPPLPEKSPSSPPHAPNFPPPSLTAQPPPSQHHPERPPQFKRKLNPEENMQDHPPPKAPQRSRTLAATVQEEEEEEHVTSLGAGGRGSHSPEIRDVVEDVRRQDTVPTPPLRDVHPLPVTHPAAPQTGYPPQDNVPTPPLRDVHPMPVTHPAAPQTGYPPQQSFSDSEDEDIPLISIQSSKPQRDDVLLMSHLNALEDSSDIEGNDMTSSHDCSPEHVTTIIRQQTSDSDVRNHGDDIIMMTRNDDDDDDDDDDGPDYMNQDAVENIINEDSEEDDALVGVVSQTSGPSTLIRQQKSGSDIRDHEDDIILMNSSDNDDYMNQDAIINAIDEVDEEEEEEDEEERIGGMAKRIISGDTIRQQKSGEDDDDIILMNSNDSEDYMNQDAIDEEQEDKLGGVVSQTSRPATLIRQQKSGSDICDHEDDIILMNSNDNEDYMNQDAIDEEQEDRLGGVAKRIMSGDTIRQQKSGRDDDDDIIAMNSNDNGEDPDYMNQDTIDELNEEEEEENEENEDRLGGVANRMIVSQTSGPKYDDDDDILGLTVPSAGADYINQVRIDNCLTWESAVIDAANSDYMNQESINAAAMGPDATATRSGTTNSAADYLNQESIDAVTVVVSPDIIVTQSSPATARNHDYLNQTVVPDAPDSDYINQDTIDWAAIEYMNQEMIDLVQTEIEKEGEERKGKGGEPTFVNQDGIDATADDKIMDENNGSYYTDDSTEDDHDDHDDRIKIHSYREPLQIHGTAPIESQETIDFDQQDYENQDVLDGDMVVEGESGISPPPLPPVPQLMATGPKTEAEMSNSNDHTVSHDPTDDEPDGLRSPMCSDKPNNETSLDFSCKRASSSRIARPRDNPKNPLSLVHTSSGVSPILMTKKRSQTNIDVLSVRLPCAAETQSSATSSQATTPSSAGGDFSHDPFGNHDPFHSRDYIPPVLPKSAGTFAGSDSKRPEALLRKLGAIPDNRYSRSSSLFTDLNSSLTESSLLPGLSRLGSTIAQDVPKTKEGFLHKKGGRRNERPWQKRWVTFDGSELKYFKNKSDKDNSCLNTVELEKMIDVKRVPDETDKQFRFDLVVINRVFQLYSDSNDDCQAWVNVLHVAISKFKPQEHEHKEGGSMHDPDKQGCLYKQGRGPFSSKTFKERYVALKGSKFAYYDTQEDFRHGRPIQTLEMCLSSIRQDMSSKFPRFIITMNNQKQYLFQSSTDLERNQWIESLTTSIMTGLNLRPKTLTRGGESKTTNNSKEVLDMIQVNSSNKTCADCSAVDPLWCVINRGILVCITCSGVHRSFGTHMSKVRSVELDDEIWKNKNILQLIVEIGNGRSNSFWEKHCKGSRLPADVEKEIREEFIRAKYLTRSWIPVGTIDGNGPSLNELLCENVTTDNVLRTIELVAQGANPCHLLRDVEDHDRNTPLAIARSSGQSLQAELLELNGASICRKEDRQSFSLVSKKGHLYKTDTDRTNWKRRYCTLDQHRGFEYFKTETDGELQGYIHVEEMFSVAKCEEELSKDPKYRHCFEVNTQGRGYLFCADTENELDAWVSSFQKIISSDAADNLGYDKVGYLKKKDPSGWKKRWFTLKGKNLAFYKREREELDEIDLRTVISLKGSDGNGSPDQHVIQITTDDKAYLLKAESQTEAESWLSALRHTQVSGVPMSEQLLTSSGIPVIVHKCLQLIESTGMDVEGLYRISGEKAKIRKLILAFNQDARGVMIDSDKYTVHDVTGTLKQFFRSLPDPLITHKLYPSFIATIQSDHEAQMYQLQTLIDQLPAVNKETLKRMIGHLWRVRENESKNKMSLSNITRLLGPTLMTVDGDPVSFSNTPYEYTCIHTMIKYYKWLFHAEDEEKKEEAIEEAVLKIKEAEMMQKKRAELMNQKKSTISSVTNFLTTVYIIGRDGDSYNTNITGITTVRTVVEEVVSRRELPPDNYALYLVLGDSESHRVLCFSEVLLAVQCSAGTEHFLLLKKNVFWETLKPYLGSLSNGMTVLLHVKEKKRWKKYPCSIVDNHFVQFRDNKGNHEVFRIGRHEFDVFAGIQQSKMDVKNPMPTKYGFWIKATKGEDHSRYLCADKEEDVLKTMAAIIRAKYPHGLETPILPANSLPSSPMSPDSINSQSPLY